MKMKKISPWKGAFVPGAPLDPPLILQWDLLFRPDIPFVS